MPNLRRKLHEHASIVAVRLNVSLPRKLKNVEW
jgi:hypothetical protein